MPQLRGGGECSLAVAAVVPLSSPRKCLRFPPTGPYVVIVIPSAQDKPAAEGIIRKLNLQPSDVEVRNPARYEREGIALKKEIAAEKPARYKSVEVWRPGV